MSFPVVCGEEVPGYSWIPVNGGQKRLTNANLANAIDWFGTIAAAYLKKQKTEDPFIVVPVPNSGCVASSSVKPQTRKLAKAVCDSLKDGSYVVDCLRWKKNLGSASKEGGPRDAGILYRNAVILEDQLKGIDKGLDVLLVDDVTTSGGHLRACVAKLQSKQLDTKIVVCGGKTIYDQANPAFHLYQDKLENYHP